MQLFTLLALLVAVAVAVLAIQNSTAPAVDLKFLIWSLQTSLINALLGSFAAGIVVMVFLWVPSAIKSASRSRSLKKEIEILEKERRHRIEESKPKEP